MYSLQDWCCSASQRLAILVLVIWLPHRSSVVSPQRACCNALHRLTTPASVIVLPPRKSVVSLQLGCCSTSQRLEKPVSVIPLAQRLSVVSLQLGSFKASHWGWQHWYQWSYYNLHDTNLQITSIHSFVRSQCVIPSLETREGSLRGENEGEKTRGVWGELLPFSLSSLPFFFLVNFSTALYNLNAWNRLTRGWLCQNWEPLDKPGTHLH